MAGGTGVVGRSLIPLLVAAGHDVVALGRTADKRAWLKEQGARAAAVAEYDGECLATFMSGADAVIDVTTHVPPLHRAGSRRAFREHDWLRDSGTRAVVQAAERTGVPRVIRDSVTFLHADGGEQWIDESWPVDPGRHLASTETGEHHVQAFAGEGVVLRFGLLYGPESSHTLETVRLAKLLRVSPVLGPPDAYLTSLHTDDAVTAVVAALHAPPGLYDVGDDEPLTRRDLARAQAAALGFKRLRRLPAAAGRGETARALTRSHRINARAFREATGWSPSHASARDGWQHVASRLP